MKKIWIDVETTGLDAKENGIIQFAMLIEDEKGKVVDKLNICIKPFPNCIFTTEALEINGKTKKQIARYMSEQLAVKVIYGKIIKHKVGYEQFEFCGYNSRFDMDFVIALFERNSVEFWKLFNYHDVDTFAFVKLLGLTGERYDDVKKKNVKCKKLVCICALFGIEFDAHDALADIAATRKLHKKLTKKYLKCKK